MFWTNQQVLRFCEFSYLHSYDVPHDMCDYRTNNNILVQELTLVRQNKRFMWGYSPAVPSES